MKECVALKLSAELIEVAPEYYNWALSERWYVCIGRYVVVTETNWATAFRAASRFRSCMNPQCSPFRTLGAPLVQEHYLGKHSVYQCAFL